MPLKQHLERHGALKHSIETQTDEILCYFKALLPISPVQQQGNIWHTLLPLHDEFIYLLFIEQVCQFMKCA